MATYTELRQLFNNDDLRNRVSTACLVYAYGLLSGTPTDAQKAFAEKVFNDPDAIGRKIMMGVLAASKDTSKAGIEGVSDSAIQTRVDALLPNFVGVI